MQEVAPDVWQLKGWPANNINAYVIGDVLIDAGTPWQGGGVLEQVRDRGLTAHALTHAHFDHYGGSHKVCSTLGIPLWCGAADAGAVEQGRMVGPGGRMVPAAKAHPVARRLAEGDDVAGFTVLDTPGHSPGHVSFWRESDRVLLCGDVMFGYNPFTLRGGAREPFPLLSPDADRNRESARRLAALDPAVVCFGHGKVLRDPAAFKAAVDRLPK